jgi:hypothetical protein
MTEWLQNMVGAGLFTSQSGGQPGDVGAAGSAGVCGGQGAGCRRCKLISRFFRRAADGGLTPDPDLTASLRSVLQDPFLHIAFILSPF